MTNEVGRPPGGGTSMTWEQVLTGGHKPLKFIRALFKHLPSDPRCKLCIAPFGGFGGRVTGLVGFGPSRMNPNFCSNCLEGLPPGGAEVELAVLFADVRGSTAMGEAISATDFAAVMNRFYRIATQTLVGHDGLIDKLLGDEVMALFLPGLCGPEYRQRACDAALSLLHAVKQDSGLSGMLSIGVAVHAGPAFVGNVGSEGVFDFTALGDTVNVAARMQSLAGSGELVVSDELYQLTELGPAAVQMVSVKGKAEPIAVRVIRAASG
ncbi:MAG: adenylate/guanylate cyclase domain-containing protein [Anaerolineaceae bacterium]